MEVTEQSLEAKASTLSAVAKATVITDVVTYAAAGEQGKGLKELRATIVNFFAPMKKAAHEAHKAITTKESEQLKPLDEAIEALRLTMNNFNREQERLRLAEEKRLQDIEDERARKEKERLEAQAEKALDKGKDDKAEQLLERAEMVYAAPVTVAPVISKTVATSAGNITQAKEINVTVMDMNAFIKALVDQKKQPTMLAAQAGPLKAWVKANGYDTFPGLNIVKTTGVRF